MEGAEEVDGQEVDMDQHDMDQHDTARRRGVVVGVDGSPHSLHALRAAAELARMRGQKLTVVTAWRPIDDIELGPGVVHTRDLSDRAAQRMRALVAEVLGEEFRDLDLEVCAPEGPPADVLVELSFGADLLVVGASGHGRLRHAVIGSVTSYCTKHAGCPVLVVPSREDRARRRRRHRDVLEEHDRLVPMQGPLL
jgi:nucleotide-binding universal stress UspA family protein